MIDFEKEFGKPGHQPGFTEKAVLSRMFKIVYGWMAIGLALSGVSAWYTASSGLWATILNGPGFLTCVIVELALVFILSAAINKMPAAFAYVMFLAYALVNGLTLSVVFVAYELAAVQRVFFITAAMFGGLALWGSFTKDDRTSVGSFCYMALWGLSVAGIGHIFMHSDALDYICSIAGILIFTGLTMYDAQKIKRLAAAEGTMDSVAIHRVGIIGALNLYLDFVNLFLHLLRLMGRKR